MLGLITGDQRQDVATDLVVLGQFRPRVAVCNLRGALLERDVGDEFSEGGRVGHFALLHLHAPSVFEQRGVDAATDVHPITHDHGVAVLFHGPLARPLANGVASRRVFEDAVRVIGQVVFGQ